MRNDSLHILKCLLNSCCLLSFLFTFPSLVLAETCQIFSPIAVDDISFVVPAWSEAPDNTGFCLTVTSHEDGEIVATALQTISGTVGDEVDTLTIAGQTITILPDGSFNHNVTLNTCWNTLKLEVTDGNNKTGSQTLVLGFNVDLISCLTFSDTNFSNCVSNTASSSGWTSVDEITILSCSSQGISNIAGIEVFTNIEVVNTHFNQITNIIPMQALTNAIIINLHGNNNIPCSQLTDLHAALPNTIISEPSTCQ